MSYKAIIVNHAASEAPSVAAGAAAEQAAGASAVVSARTVPPVLLRLHPSMSVTRFASLCDDKKFLYRNLRVCEDCAGLCKKGLQAAGGGGRDFDVTVVGRRSARATPEPPGAD